MGVTVASPDLRPSLYSVLDGLLDAGLLDALVTKHVIDPSRPLHRAMLRMLPAARAPHRQVPERLRALTHAVMPGELLRIAAGRVNRRLGHHLWLRQELAFDARVSRRFAGRSTLLLGMEHACLESLRAQHRAGGLTAMRQVTAHGDVAFERYHWERARFPQLFDRGHAYVMEDLQRSRERKRAEYAEADLLLCNSDYVADSMRACGVQAERVVAVPTGCPPLTETAANAGRGSAPLRVLMVGTVGLRKGIHELLEAIARLPRGAVDLRLAGGVEHPHWGARALAVGAVLLGHIDRAALVQEWAKADLFVLPSHLEGLAHSLLEALSAGLPLLVTRETGAGRLLEDGQNGRMVAACDVDALHRGLEEALDRRGELPAWGAHSRIVAERWPRAASNAAALTALRSLHDRAA